MQVCHVISGIHPRAGGTTFALAGLTAAQAAVGLDVCVVNTFSRNQPQNLGHELFHPKVRMHSMGPVRKSLSLQPRFTKELYDRARQADVLHVHGLWESVQHFAAVAARRLDRRYVVTTHGMLQPWAWEQSRLKLLKKHLYLRLRLRRDLNGAAAIHYTTSEERDNAARFGFEAPVVIEANGLDLSEFDPLPQKGFLRARLPATRNGPIVLFLGRLHPVKGLDIAIDAFAKMAAAAAPGSPADCATLVLAGPDRDGYAAKLRPLANRGGVADRVLYTGMLDARERVAALADADLFVLPSYSENYGVAATEAMAARLPVLVSNQVQAHPEVTAAGGGVVLPCDAQAFAKAMLEWLSHAERRQLAGTNSRRHAMRRLNWSDIAHRWADHYERLLRTQTRVRDSRGVISPQGSQVAGSCG